MNGIQFYRPRSGSKFVVLPSPSQGAVIQFRGQDRLALFRPRDITVWECRANAEPRGSRRGDVRQSLGDDAFLFFADERGFECFALRAGVDVPDDLPHRPRQVTITDRVEWRWGGIQHRDTGTWALSCLLYWLGGWRGEGIPIHESRVWFGNVGPDLSPESIRQAWGDTPPLPFPTSPDQIWATPQGDPACGAVLAGAGYYTTGPKWGGGIAR